jgi:eukaryotic-like serine/threonine-protein kinase
MSWHRVILYVGIMIGVFLSASYLTVSVLLKTGETVICPDIRGKSVEDARQLVESRGLSLAVMKHERRNDVPYNHITVQKPEANISTRKGRTVLVIASEGPELIQIPVFLGQSAERVEEKLKEIHIEIEKTIYVPSQKTGKVVSQIPKGGEEILEGKGIILFVGAEQNSFYVMPDVKTLGLSDLAAEMDKKKIKHKITQDRGEIGSHSRMIMQTTIPPRSVFKGSDEIEIKVVPGGPNE